MNALLADERNWPMISEELTTAGVKEFLLFCCLIKMKIHIVD